MIDNIYITVLLIFLEAAYIFISLKAIIREKLSVARNAFLFFGIIAANLGSGILYGTPFRFLLVAALIFWLIKLVCREKVYFYNFFLVMAIYAVKMTIEIFAMFVVGFENFTTSVAVIGGLVFLFVPIVLFMATRRLCEKIHALWIREDSFYIRFSLCLVMFVGIFLYIWAVINSVQSIL